MKNFLAVDTSCGYMSVVAVKDGNAFCSYLPDCTMKHSVLLMQTVDETLKKADMTLGDCDFFAAVVGAGSFTGIRIGISAVKGFCLATGKPALPITSFDVTAYNALDGEKILCLVDALHGYYYACGYEKGEATLAPAYLSETEVLALKEQGYKLVSCENLAVPAKIVSPVEGLKNAAIALGERGAFAPLDALYIRKSSAELNAEKGK